LNSEIFLFTGAARSGKSTMAEQKALKVCDPRDTIAYIACARAIDEEFSRRIKKHQARRGEIFITYEEPLDIADVMQKAFEKHQVIIIECLATWLGNIFYELGSDTAEAFALEQIEKIKNQIVPLMNKNIIIVTNETGWGIVPENPETRLYRDLLGIINSRIAAMASQVILAVCGIGVQIK